MQVLSPLHGLEFSERRPHATPLVPGAARVVRFALRAGQSLRTHDALPSFVYLFIVKGEGVFDSAAAASPRHVRGGGMIVIDPGETYAVRALDDLVFVAVRDGGAGAASTAQRELAGATA